jgi:hypothetical protein
MPEWSTAQCTPTTSTQRVAKKCKLHPNKFYIVKLMVRFFWGAPATLAHISDAQAAKLKWPLGSEKRKEIGASTFCQMPLLRAPFYQPICLSSGHSFLPCRRLNALCTVLYCTVLYCTVLCSAVVCCALLCFTVLYSTVLHCTAVW